MSFQLSQGENNAKIRVNKNTELMHIVFTWIVDHLALSHIRQRLNRASLSLYTLMLHAPDANLNWGCYAFIIRTQTKLFWENHFKML